MWRAVNAVLNTLFDVLFWPVHALPAEWQVAVLALPGAALALGIYKVASNQAAIRDAKSKIVAHLLELRLFRDDLRVLLRAEGKVFTSIGRYLGHSLLPMALMLGLLLAVARLYRDSEMAVLTAIGVGPRRLLRPLLLLVLPVVALVGACSLWLGPWADRTSERLIDEANRSVLMAGLEAGRFTTLPNGGVVYLSSVSPDGTQLGSIFMQRQREDRRVLRHWFQQCGIGERRHRKRAEGE